MFMVSTNEKWETEAKEVTEVKEVEVIQTENVYEYGKVMYFQNEAEMQEYVAKCKVVEVALKEALKVGGNAKKLQAGDRKDRIKFFEKLLNEKRDEVERVMVQIHTMVLPVLAPKTSVYVLLHENGTVRYELVRHESNAWFVAHVLNKEVLVHIYHDRSLEGENDSMDDCIDYAKDDAKTAYIHGL